jgi:hypothetical protein
MSDIENRAVFVTSQELDAIAAMNTASIFAVFRQARS